MAKSNLSTLEFLNARLRPLTIALPVVGALFAGSSAASADTFNYTGGYPPTTNYENVTLTFTPPSSLSVTETGGMGEIHLSGYYGSAPSTPVSLDVFCMDVYHWLAAAGTYNVDTLGTLGSGFPNPGLTPTVLGEIGALVANASTYITGGFANSDGRNSAAFQLAIWQLEYGSAVTFTNVDPTTQSRANSFENLAIAGAGIWAAFAPVTLLSVPDADIGHNQDLVYVLAGTRNIIPQTPLPAALPLFATGLGALGALGWRRKRKTAVALAA